MKAPSENLVSLKILLFFFFGGIGCLFPFLPLHMEKVGLTAFEARVVSSVAPLFAMLGPILACPLADRVCGTSRANNGRGLRMLLAVIMVLGAACYALLMTIPTVTRLDPERKPDVTMYCGPQGAILQHERCVDPPCHTWDPSHIGLVNLSDCYYSCGSVTVDKPETLPEVGEPEEEEEEVEEESNLPPPENDPIFDDGEEEEEAEAEAEVEESEENEEEVEDEEGEEEEEIERSQNVKLKEDEENEEEEEPTENIEEDEDDDGEGGSGIDETSGDGNPAERKRRETESPVESDLPHLCYVHENGNVMCEVYTKFSTGIMLNASLDSEDGENPRGEMCQYALYSSGKQFSCRIPSTLPSTCRIRCNVEQTDSPKYLLGDNHCQQIKGDPVLTFWSYLLVRSVADMFPTAAIALLAAATVIATWETNVGRGDVGRQLAFGWLGLAIFSPIAAAISSMELGGPVYWPQFAFCAVLLLCASAVALFASNLPIGPLSWWWHARGSTSLIVRRYGCELLALTVVLILLGIFWSALDSYLPWHLVELQGSELVVALTLTAGALPAIPFLWYSEHIVDFCGHTNLLIIAFIFYIIRYTGLSALWNVWWLLLCSEALELLTVTLAWLAAILYLRHLVPRHLTATGQGLAVVAHFCIGRCIGAIIGGAISPSSPETGGTFMPLYRVGAVAAAVVATIYFIVYHLFLKPCCLATANKSGPSSRSGVGVGPTTNGTYTQLRVYQNPATDGNKRRP